MLFRNLLRISFGLTIVFCSPADGQESCVSYKLVPQTTFKTQPMTLATMVNETVLQPQQITTYKPVWTSETRERRTVVLKPVVTTSEREERYLVKRPIIETSYRERQIEETSYETITEMKEQRYLVEIPVVETQFREEKVLVRKPVTSTVMQTENVTTYKPVTVNETQYIAGANVRNDLVLQSNGRNRLRWLQNGNYVNPTTGGIDYRKRGFHWVPDQTLALRPTIEPTLIEQQVARTTYAAETVQVQKPVQVTNYVDQYETRKVPVQVNSTSQKIHVVKIPVTVQKPITKIRTERTPVQEVKYREEIYVRRVPVTETTYQRVEQVEPYEVEVCKWVAETKEIQVPTTVTRRVNHTVNRMIPETSWIQVPVDAFGNILPMQQVVSTPTRSTIDYPIAKQISNAPIIETYSKPVASSNSGSSAIIGDPIVVRKLGEDEYRDIDRQRIANDKKSDSILVPETKTDLGKPSTEMIVVKKPPAVDPAETVPTTDVPEKEPMLEVKPIVPVEIDDQEKSPTLEIDSSDKAEIDIRPGTQDADDDLLLDDEN